MWHSPITDFVAANKAFFTVLLKVVIVLILTKITAIIVDRYLNSYFAKTYKDMDISKTSYVLIKKMTSVIVYIIGIAIAVYMVPSLRQLSVSIMASAGFMGIVVGFAAKDALSNTIAGIFIASFRPFRVGDNLTVNDFYGTVEDITLRHTIIVTLDNDRVIVPNSEIINTYLINHSIKDEKSRFAIEIGIAYRDSISKARELVMDEIDKEELALKEDSRMIISELGNNAVVLKVFVWGKDRGEAWRASQALRESIKKRFQKEGITIPFPQRTISYLEEEEKEELEQVEEPEEEF